MSTGRCRRPEIPTRCGLEPATLTTRRRRLIHEPIFSLASHDRERLHSARSAPQARDQEAGKSWRQACPDRAPLTRFNLRGGQNPEISTPLTPVEDRGRRCQRGSRELAPQPRSANCGKSAPSQREFPSSRTLPRRVRVPQCATFPAPLLQQGRLKQSLPVWVERDKAHPPTPVDTKLKVH